MVELPAMVLLPTMATERKGNQLRKIFGRLVGGKKKNENEQ